MPVQKWGVRSALIVFCCFVGTACTSGRRLNSYPLIGARAQYGADTDDGVTVHLPLESADAVGRVIEAFGRAGYTLDSTSVRAGSVRTLPFPLQADTTMRISAQVISLEPSAAGSSVVLTAVYSTSRRTSLPIFQKAGQVNPLYTRLQAFAKSIHQKQ